MVEAVASEPVSVCPHDVYSEFTAKSASVLWAMPLPCGRIGCKLKGLHLDLRSTEQGNKIAGEQRTAGEITTNVLRARADVLPWVQAEFKRPASGGGTGVSARRCGKSHAAERRLLARVGEV